MPRRRSKTSKSTAFLLDSNVWVALTFDAHPGHGDASVAMTLATRRRPALFCRATQLSFLRLISTPALLEAYGVGGMTNDDALESLYRLLASPVVSHREEPAGLERIWHRLAARPTASPKVWMDAYLAAFAIAGKAQLVTFDHGIQAFEAAGLDVLLLQASSGE